MSVPLRCSYQTVFVWICVCIWIVSVCVLAHTCMMQRWEVSTSPCNPKPASSCVPYVFFSPYPLIPSLVLLKWQFVKHGPLLALSFASQPFPARLLPSHSSLHITRFTPFPLFHFHTSCASAMISLYLSFRHFILFIHPSKCDCYSTYRRLSLFISCPLFLLHCESPRNWFS